MKLFISSILFVLCISNALAQPGWFTQTSGTGQHLDAVYFANSNTGWIVGDNGLILKSTNGGSSWFGQPSNALNKLMSVHFLDVNTGWVAGYAATLRNTSNSGDNWLSQDIGPGWLPWSLNFVDENNGWIACEFGIILHTTNGGTNWLTQESGTGEDLYSVHFADSNTGWVVGGGGTILRTTNSGINWTAQSSGTWVELRSVFSTDANTAWAAGWFGSVLKTTNGGAVWFALPSGIGNNLRSVFFIDENTGWVVGWEGSIIRTSTGGASWISQTSGSGSLLWSVYFTDANTGWAVGTYGTILKTTTGGIPPPPLPFCGPGPHLVDYCSGGTDSLNIIHNCETQAIVRLSLDTSGNCNVPSVMLPVFAGPTVVRRSDPKDTSGRFPGVAQLDGHNDIIETEMLEMDLRTFVESNGDTAFLNIVAGAGRGTGPCGSELNASYGYIHELPAYSYNAESFFDIFIEICIEDPHGIIGPPNPRYYLYNLAQVGMKATIDQIPPKCGRDPNTNEYYTVYRPDPNTCSKLYASCIPGTGNPPLAKIVHVEHALPVEFTSFASATSGNDVALNWTTSEEINNSGFSIERSSGTNWNEIGFVAGKGNYNSVSSYEITDKNLASGIYHYRLKQIDFNGNYEYFELPEAVTIGVPDKFFVDQNYPNPFNPTTTIGYGIPQSGNITLKIFDMTGKEIRTLVNEYKEAGYYVARFDGSSLSSGTYIYRTESGNFVTAKKMVMLK